MEDMELVCFKIISAVGEAKSDYIMAIEEAEKVTSNVQKN